MAASASATGTDADNRRADDQGPARHRRTVSEQHGATAEIARSVNDFAESSIGISRVVDTVGTDAGTTRRTATSLLAASRDLAREAAALSQRIAAFKERTTKAA